MDIKKLEKEFDKKFSLPYVITNTLTEIVLLEDVWSWISTQLTKAREEGYVSGLIDGRKKYFKSDPNHLMGHTNVSSTQNQKTK